MKVIKNIQGPKNLFLENNKIKKKGIYKIIYIGTHLRKCKLLHYLMKIRVNIITTQKRSERKKNKKDITKKKKNNSYEVFS